MIERQRNMPWILLAVAALVITGVGMFAFSEPRTTTSPTPGPTATGSNPIPERVAVDKPQNQASPQGPTGPLTTGTGGAPASSPQGEAPAGMQVSPPGASDPK
jgi:hypothetical protein